MHAFARIVLTGSTVALTACGSPSPQCVGEGISILQQGGFPTSVSQTYCKNTNAYLVAISSNTCDPSDTFEYISNNAEEIINSSPLAGLPAQVRKNEAIRLSKSAGAVVKACALN